MTKQEQIKRLQREIYDALVLMHQAKKIGDLQVAELHKQTVSHLRTEISALLEMTKTELENAGFQFAGWGLIGEPQPGVVVAGPCGRSLDCTGYSESCYWEQERIGVGEEVFQGPDIFGVVPMYVHADGRQFPADAKSYPYLA